MRESKLNEIKSVYEDFKTYNLKKVDRETHFLDIESYDCYLKNGEVLKREKILKGRCDGSASIILPITVDNEFILAIEPRVFTKNTVDIGLPAGYIEIDESPELAAKRELLEETGYEAGELIHVGGFYQDQGCSSAYNHYYIATNCRKVGNQQLDNGEFIKYVLVYYDELLWLLDNNYIKGLNSAYLIEKVKTRCKER